MRVRVSRVRVRVSVVSGNTYTFGDHCIFVHACDEMYERVRKEVKVRVRVRVRVKVGVWLGLECDEMY